MARKAAAPFPTRDEVVSFIADSPTPLTKRDLVRAFQIGVDDRPRFKALLRDIETEGAVDRGHKRRFSRADALPGVTVVRVVAVASDGEMRAIPDRWDEAAPPPPITIAHDNRPGNAVTTGGRALVRLTQLPGGGYTGKIIKALDAASETRAVGVLRRGRAGWTFQSADRRQRDPLPLDPGAEVDAVDGDVVVASLETSGRLRPARVRVMERLGRSDDPKVFSLLALHGAGIPTAFPDAALRDAEAATFRIPDDYADLRALPLVTIDGADARDFDDAVFAEPDGAGWHLVVAIADVAHYVRPGSPLDREAERRGNSVYLPDRVVPMLPEALSNGLCSLVPDEDRLCLAAHLWIDAAGNLVRHRFERGVMRSHARLTYEQAQAAQDGQPQPDLEPLMAVTIRPLYGAFAALSKARAERGTLDLDLPERIVQLGTDGHVTGIGTRTRLDSHRLIEEFMIAANVAAAQSLTGGPTACLYRVHDAPDDARLEALRDALSPLGYRLARGQVIRPRAFTQILDRVQGTAHAPMVNEMVLRAQAQANYSPDNIGHFGLALPLYAHFTSPIRRYADLTVHRALIRRFSLGRDGTSDEEQARLAPIGDHISMTERRSATAERDSVDRFTAAYLAEQVGQTFDGRIQGVTKFGLFVRLAETGADGLVPISTLPEDFYAHEETAQCLVGRRWGRIFGLGADVRAQLVQADALTGGCLLKLVDVEDGAPGDLAPKALKENRAMPGRSGPKPRGGRRYGRR